MAKFRSQVSVLLDNGLFLTDGGLFRHLLFDKRAEFPEFSVTIELLADYSKIKSVVGQYYEPFIRLLKDEPKLKGFIMECIPTFKGSWEVGQTVLQGDRKAWADYNTKSVQILEEIRATSSDLTLISAPIGPKNFVFESALTIDEYERYHEPQVEVLSKTGADFITAMTMDHPDEVIGLAKACFKHKVPMAVSFIIGTDGKLPNGQSLDEAIQAVETACEKLAKPLYYVVDCAHPSWIEKASETRLLKGVRVNATRLTHKELFSGFDLAPETPQELTAQVKGLNKTFSIIGGCCGTNFSHACELAKKL